MDAADLRNLFYIVATIALILVSFSIIAIFYLIIRIRKVADNAVTTWQRLSVARLLVRIVKLIF